MKRFITLLITLLLSVAYTMPAFAAATKGYASVAAWAEIAANGRRHITYTSNIDTSYSQTLWITVALSAAQDHPNGAIITVMVNCSGANDDWYMLGSQMRGVQTSTACTKSDVLVEAAATSINIEVTDPGSAGNLDHHDKFIFIENTVAVANSEVVYLTDHDDATDDIDILLGLAHTQETSADIFTINGDGQANSPVSFHGFTLPLDVKNIDIIIFNDDAACTIHTQAHITFASGL